MLSGNSRDKPALLHQRMNILITNADQRSALGVIRSLGRRGFNITAMSDTSLSSGFYSKYVSKHKLYSSPSNVDAFLNDIIAELKTRTYDFLIPIADMPVAIFSAYRQELLPFTQIPISHDNAIQVALSKAQTVEMAPKCGVPIPKTFFLEDIPDIDCIIRSIQFPMILKTDSVFQHDGRLKSGYVVRINSEFELRQRYKEALRYSCRPIIQECIKGMGYGVAVLLNQGMPKALFTYRRIREVPYSGGPSSLREGVRFTQIEEYALKLMKALKWHGVGMVEFKMDDRDNIPKLMEINPRFWGAIHLAIHSGVDFPYLLIRTALGEDVGFVNNYKTGVKCRWLFTGDLRHLESVFRYREIASVSRPSRLKTLLHFCKFRERDLYYDYFQKDDMKPAIANIAFAFARLFRHQK